MKVLKLTNKQRSGLIGLFVLIVILLLHSLPTEAQINQQFKGERITLDTAIVMHVNVYRNIRNKVYTADSTIALLEFRIYSQGQLIDLLQQETRNLITQTQLRDDYISETKTAISEIKTSIKEIKDLPKTKLPFYKQDWFLIIVGSLAVVGMVR